MIAVEVPKDLTKIKTKFIGPFTKRQCIALAASAVMGVPIYLFTYKNLGTTIAAYFMLICVSPILMAGFVEKDGKPITAYYRNMLNFLFVRKKCRPYVSENIYSSVAECIRMKKEFKTYADLSIKQKQKKSTRKQKTSTKGNLQAKTPKIIKGRKEKNHRSCAASA